MTEPITGTVAARESSSAEGTSRVEANPEIPAMSGEAEPSKDEGANMDENEKVKGKQKKGKKDRKKDKKKDK